MLPDSVHQIYGHVSLAEMELLYELAAAVPAGGRIVEIGSFQGKSTVCLGLGAKQAGAWVYAIDPHEDCQINETTHYGMENHAMLLANLVLQGVADVVRVIALCSEFVVRPFGQIELLWIDGSHKYHDVWFDLVAWSKEISPNGRIALHDSTGHFPDVIAALDDFIFDGGWQITKQVDATTVLERVK